MINEHSAMHAILRIVETPEEAHEMVQYLTTLDWHKVFAGVEQKAKDHLQQCLDQGGGYCDKCRELIDRSLTYRVFSPRHTGNFCSSCIIALQKHYDVPLDERLDVCEKCWNLFNILELHRDDLPSKIKAQYYGYCDDCLAKLIEMHTITCLECGKRTLEYTYQNICDECYVKYPEYSTVVSHNRRAKALNLPASLTAQQWRQAVEHFNHKCAYCQKKPYTVLEHFIPLAKQGGTTANNCVPACQHCNSKKADKSPEAFAMLFPPANIGRIRAYLQDKE